MSKTVLQAAPDAAPGAEAPLKRPRRAKAVADEAELLRFFTALLRDEAQPAQHRIKAAELLARLQGLPADTPPDTTIRVIASPEAQGWME